MKLINIKKISKLLTRIVLINFIILFNLNAFSGKAFSDTNPFKDFETSDPFCEENSDLFAGKYNLGHPEAIYININNSNTWFKRVLKGMYSKDGRIDKRLKKYQRAEITIKYKNSLECKVNARIRIHGGGNDHIDKHTLNASVRVQIQNGHIGHKYNFALIMERSGKVVGRDAPEEIFASTLFEEFGFLSPLHFRTKVRINSEIDSNYLFVEMPTNEMAKKYKRNNGVFISGNKNDFRNLRYLGKSAGSLVLSRVKNSNGISYKNKDVLLYALDKLNYIHLNSHGIGNGDTCCGKDLIDETDIIHKEYLEGTRNLRLNPYLDKKSIRKNSIYNLLLNATNAHHGQSLEDRIFFYDPTYGTLEPVYHDADSNILKNEPLLYSRIFNSEKKYIDETKLILQNIDLFNFQTKLSSRGFNIEIEKLEKIFDTIRKHLDTISESVSLKEYPANYAPNYFERHSYKDLPYYLAFGGMDNEFEICNVELTKCQKKKLTDKEFYKLLSDKYINIKGFNKKIFYVRLFKKSYENNIEPFPFNISKFSSIELEGNFKLSFNTKIDNIDIDKKNKTIHLNQELETDRFIFTGKNIDPWSIKFNGINKNQTIRYKRDKNMIGGCIAFIDSEINNISINLKNSLCPKSIEVLRSKGSFDEILIKNAAGDGFDSELSEIIIKNIIVKNAKGECIGVKRGNYSFEKSKLSHCSDKAISTGEHAFTTIIDATVSNSFIGIASKDSSSVEVLGKYEIKKSKYCLRAYRGKFNYHGSVIKIHKDKIFCNNSIIEIDKNSKIKYF